MQVRRLVGHGSVLRTHNGHAARNRGEGLSTFQVSVTRGLPIIPAWLIYVTNFPRTPLNLLLAYFSLTPNIHRVLEILREF